MSDDPAAPDDGDAGAKQVDRAERSNVMLMAVIEAFGGGTATRHRVRDLSSGGVRVDNAAGLRSGATVLISVGALQSVGATVKWVREGTAGLAFAQPINPENARKKAAIPPGAPAGVAPVPTVGSVAPTAGWIRDLRNPYRR